MDWSEFGLTILSYVLPVLAAVIGSLVAWGVKKLVNKWGIQLDLHKDSQLRIAVRAAIKGAEEWAARKMKLDTDKAVTGAEKASWVQKRIQRMFPELLPDDLEALIDEELASMWGVGSTGERVVNRPVMFQYGDARPHLPNSTNVDGTPYIEVGDK